MKRIWIYLLIALGAIIPALQVGLTPLLVRDFGSLWLAGHGFREGIDIYGVDSFREYGRQLAGIEAHYNFTYPPHLLFLLVPLGLIPPVVAFIAWNILSAVLFYFAARPLMPRGLPPLIAILMPAAIVNASFGQTGLITAALFLFAFRGSGAAAAMLTFKPHVGFLVLLAMLRERRQFVIAVVLTIALLFASALLFRNWPDFIAHALDFQGAAIVDGNYVAWVVAGVSPFTGYGIWGWLVYAGAAAYLLSRRFDVFTAATATFLISPYAFHYDMAAACLGFAILLWNCWDDSPAWQKIILSFAYLAPIIVQFGTWLIPPILLLALFVQVDHGRSLRPDDNDPHGARAAAA